MHTLSNSNFGPVVAYLVPGATALLGFSPFSETLRSWFAATPDGTPTIGGFLYLTVASLAAGNTANRGSRRQSSPIAPIQSSRTSTG